MEQKEIKALIREKTDELATLSAAIGDAFDQEIIHDFRVGVKTLRSFLRLQSMNTGNEQMKIPASFKRLYRIAGAIRDAQLELEQMETIHSQLPHYVSKLQKVLEALKKEWEKHYSKKVLRKLEDKLTGYTYKKMDISALSGFFDMKMATIGTLVMVKTPTDDQVHDIRKEVKDIIYTTKLARKKWKAAQDTAEAVPLTQLDKLADAIGDYNDQRITQEHLRSFSSQTMDTAEQNTISGMGREYTSKLKTKKKKILGMAKKLPPVTAKADTNLL